MRTRWNDVGRRACRDAVCRRRASPGNRHRRSHRADDRPVRAGRQADGGGGKALHARAWRHRRRQEDPACRQGRRRRPRQLQAPGAGARRQRPGEVPDRHGPDADRAGRRADRHGGQGARGGHPRRHFDHHREIALHRAHQFHPGAVGGGHRRLGGRERHQEGRHPGLRLCARPGRREGLRGAVQEGGRRGARSPAGAAAEPRLRSLPAARRRCQAGRPLHLRPGKPGRRGDEAVRRARPRQVRHKADRSRRLRRRRSAQRHGRRGTRRGDRTQLFGRPSVRNEQGLRRGLQGRQ